MGKKDLTPQEQWVLDQLEKGEIADLKKQFGEEEENRGLRAKFIEALLTDEIEGFKPHRRGINIAHALISDPMDLEHVEVPYNVGLVDFIFREKVNLMDALFKKHLNLNRTQFSKTADFHRIKVNQSLFCRNTRFQGRLDLGSANIGGEFSASGAQLGEVGKNHLISFNSISVGESAVFKGASFQGPVDFRLSKVKKSLYLDQLKTGDGSKATTFHGLVDFGGARIDIEFNANGAQFGEKDKDHRANFNGMKVGENTFFKGAVFKGEVNFTGADIGGQFNAQGAQFQGKGQGNRVTFNSMKVGHIAFFNGAKFRGPVDFQVIKVSEHFGIRPLAQEQGGEQPTVFQGPVNFGMADIGGQFTAERAQFQGPGPENRISFNGLKVGQIAFFNGTEFRGPVDFRGATFAGQFNAKGAQFQGQGPENEVNFSILKVGLSAIFENAVFQGEVDFSGAEIDGQFIALGAEFYSSSQLNFEGLNVGESAFFEGAVFKGTVGLNDAHLLDLIMGYKPIPALNLEHTRIDRELKITDAEIGSMEAKNLAVHGTATLDKVTLKDKADLRNASFYFLDLLQVTWPPEKQKVWLEGLTYQAISAGSNPEDWVTLLTWVEGSRFNTQNYSQLEAFFSRCGHRDSADKVFIKGKREAANRLTWWKKWLTKIFWGGLTGYGRKPWQVLYVILPLVALGTFLFAPEFTAKSLESYGWLNQMKQNHPWIIQFLVSLDRFLPGVDLGLAKEWSPACVGLCTFAFWHFLKLAGWITIPIALAAIYTRIK